MIESSIIKICSIAKDFNNSINTSPYQIVLERKDAFNKSSLNKVKIIKYLKMNRDLIKDWLLYSENKRTSTGWYFKDYKNKWLIGFMNEGIIESEKIFDSKFEACAEYVLNEIESILK
ncbi:MAG: hypothetical protein OQJ93_03095 [Ignavibacteriaceae bacterium]|nr:hypothetical protein [Ignavibacteriaceae bacterium]MCW8813128.1 hypothetical protein [Chlorobium sp.]MCW8817960.1 hypothetical protein [Ignavibacteriaceae bacterium]MCW8823663.1 hypothetical protein [Ignavibacteriaceae bacterium]MCW9095688.1 hypothetical protein [Ignavibacteriaceae bacterium]